MLGSGREGPAQTKSSLARPSSRCFRKQPVEPFPGHRGFFLYNDIQTNDRGFGVCSHTSISKDYPGVFIRRSKDILLISVYQINPSMIYPTKPANKSIWPPDDTLRSFLARSSCSLGAFFSGFGLDLAEDSPSAITSMEGIFCVGLICGPFRLRL